MMKKLLFITLLALAVCGCKKDEAPVDEVTTFECVNFRDWLIFSEDKDLILDPDTERIDSVAIDTCYYIWEFHNLHENKGKLYLTPYSKGVLYYSIKMPEGSWKPGHMNIVPSEETPFEADYYFSNDSLVIINTTTVNYLVKEKTADKIILLLLYDDGDEFEFILIKKPD